MVTSIVCGHGCYRRDGDEICINMVVCAIFDNVQCCQFVVNSPPNLMDSVFIAENYNKNLPVLRCTCVGKE